MSRCSPCFLWATYTVHVLLEWIFTHKTVLAKFIHKLQTLRRFPHLTCKVQRACLEDMWHVFMACITGSWMHWMLLTVNYTPLSSHSFIQEDALCILLRDLCNFPARFTMMIEQGICIFSIVSWGIKLYFYAVIVHMYLCTECVYWYETHSYCYLCIAKFI